jgi:two-component system, NarL family, nitrate/nitrite response regulator NarL
MSAPLQSSATVRILLVDDHAMFREGVKLLLQRDARLEVIGEAGDPAKALELTARERPDIVLLDIDLAGHDGLDMIESLQASSPASDIIVLTGIRDEGLQARALRSGAKGFVQKDQNGDLVLRAIQKVHEGEIWFDRSTIGAAVTRLIEGDSDEQAQPLGTLTARERDITRLVGEGLKNDAIAQRLFISEKTVRNHLTVIFDKVGVRDRLHLAIYAYRRGLAKLPF